MQTEMAVEIAAEQGVDAHRGFSVAQVLEQRAHAMRKRRKRVRTRAALLAVAAREIETVGYDGLTVDHIANAAAMARGTFYLYFTSRSDIVKSVLRKYWALMRMYRPRGGGIGLKESIHRANTYSVMLAARNPRLLQAREILMREDPQVAALMASVNRFWSERIIHDLERRGLAHNNDTAFLRMKTRAVIAMSDTLLSDVHTMAAWGDSPKAGDLELVVKVMDDLWYRSLYMVNAEPGHRTGL